jgi:tetratricopeptide (TPR) repeat protein
MPSVKTAPRILLLSGLAAVMIGCSATGEKKKLLEHADTLMLQAKYPEAVKESRRVLQIDDNDHRANRQLGLAYLELGELSQAYHFLLRAQASNPEDGGVRLALGSIYSIEGESDQAREQADRVMKKDSTNAAALLLLSGTVRTFDDVDRTIHKLEAAQSVRSDDTRRKLALGVLYLRKRDTATAGKLFRDALSTDPKSVEARAVLASFSTQPRGSPAVDQRRTAVTPPPANSSSERLNAIKFFLLLQQRAEAKTALQSILENDPNDLPARRLLAEVALLDGDANQALKAVAPILAKDSSDVDALVLRGRAHLVASQVDDAIRDFQRASHAAPEIAPIHYDLGVAHIRRANATSAKPLRDSAFAQARSELDEATKLAKDYPEAVFQLAQLKIQLGASRLAIADMERFVAANPASIRGQELLGDALAASGRNAEATEALQRVTQIAPRDPEGHYRAGLSFLSERKNPDARREFEIAAALSPAYAEPTTQLVMMDLIANHVDSALARVQKQLEAAPQSAPLYDLLGWVRAVRNERDAAEAALLKSVQLDPTIVDARMRLAELYNASGKFDQAVEYAEQAQKLDPKNVRVLLALGVAHQQKGDAARARQVYETALAADPRSVGAANNLAYLLSEQGDQNNAYRYAAQAQQLAPGDPHVADTFGWILFKRGEYDRARDLLKDAATKLPESPRVQYHFGMIAQKLGDVEGARAALTKAVNSSASFADRDEARRALVQLK